MWGTQPVWWITERKQRHSRATTRDTPPFRDEAAKGWATRCRSGGGRGRRLGRGSDGGYGRRNRGVFGGLPVAEATAEQGGGAALTAEDDDVVLKGKVGVPGHEFYVVGRGYCEDPMVTGFLLDSAGAGE